MAGRRVKRGATVPADEAAAWAEALRFLGRRPRSASEVEAHLLTHGWEPGTVRATLERLRRVGYVDDRVLAQEYVARRAERLGHAPSRLIEELVARGVPPDVARAAREEAAAGDADDEAVRLGREIAARLAVAGGPVEPRRLRRVYNALIRAGYDPERVRAALEPFLDAHVPGGDESDS